MATETVDSTLNRVADVIQIKIFSYLTLNEIIQTVTILSKKYNEMANNNTLWKQMHIKSVKIGVSADYEKDDHDSIIRHIHVNDIHYKNPPKQLFEKLRLIPLNLFELKINPGFKSYGPLSIKSIQFIHQLFTDYLSIKKVRKVTFWSTADYNSIYEKLKTDVISRTDLFCQILEICNPEIFDTQCAIVPQIIPPKCIDNIKELYVGDDRQKHYDLNDLCNILKQLTQLQTIHIGEICSNPNEEKLKSIPWPKTLVNVHWYSTPIRIMSKWESKETNEQKKRKDELMKVLEQDIKSKCSNLKIFGKKKKQWQNLMMT